MAVAAFAMVACAAPTDHEGSQSDENAAASRHGTTASLDTASGALRIVAGDDVLVLTPDDGRFAARFTSPARGEESESGFPQSETTLPEALEAFRVQADGSSKRRFEEMLTATAQEVARWESGRRSMAERALASFAVAHAASPAPAAGSLTPKRAPGPGDCSSSCSVRSNSGYSCSATCRQGWWYENCATCSVYDNGTVNCSCDW